MVPFWWYRLFCAQRKNNSCKISVMAFRKPLQTIKTRRSNS
jgi:hypothetical protein